ncbi:hypothetical protein JVV71_20340, partial [Vibrio cholerae O1]|nr:hypothetical protein [Vibrio cholerae O1]
MMALAIGTMIFSKGGSIHGTNRHYNGKPATSTETSHVQRRHPVPQSATPEPAHRRHATRRG